MPAETIAKVFSARQHRRQRNALKRQLRPIVGEIDNLRTFATRSPYNPTLSTKALEPFLHLIGLIMRLVGYDSESPPDKVRSFHGVATDTIFMPLPGVQSRFVAFKASVDPKHLVLTILGTRKGRWVEGGSRDEIQQGVQPVSNPTFNGKDRTHTRIGEALFHVFWLTSCHYSGHDLSLRLMSPDSAESAALLHIRLPWLVSSKTRNRPILWSTATAKWSNMERRRR